MAASIAFWLFMVFLFGAGMLMLVMGFVSTEERRAREEERRREQEQLADQAMATIPSFFVRPDAVRTVHAQIVLDDRLLADLEKYVRAEQTLVTRFVAEPSIESLYRQPSVAMFN